MAMVAYRYMLFSNHSGGGVIDTQRSFYYESGRYSTVFVRIVRVYYMSSSSVRRPIQTISYKTFVPAQLSVGSMFSPPMFEQLNQCMARAMAWLKVTSKCANILVTAKQDIFVVI